MGKAEENSLTIIDNIQREARIRAFSKEGAITMIDMITELVEKDPMIITPTTKDINDLFIMNLDVNIDR